MNGFHLSDDEKRVLAESGIDAEQLQGAAAECKELDSLRQRFPALYANVLNEGTEKPKEQDGTKDKMIEGIREKLAMAIQGDQSIETKKEDSKVLTMLRRGWIDAAVAAVGKESDIAKIIPEIQAEFFAILERDIERDSYHRSVAIKKKFSQWVDFTAQAQEGIRILTQRGNITKTKKLLKLFDEPISVYASAIFDGYAEMLATGNKVNADAIRRELGGGLDFTSAMKSGFGQIFKKQRWPGVRMPYALKIVSDHPDVDFKEPGMSIIGDFMKDSYHLDFAVQMQNALKVPASDEALHEQAMESLPTLLANTNDDRDWYYASDVKALMDKIQKLAIPFGLSKDDLVKIGAEAVQIAVVGASTAKYAERKLDRASAICDVYQLGEIQLKEHVGTYPAYLRSVIEVFSLESCKAFATFYKKNIPYIDFLRKNRSNPTALETADVRALSALNITALEAERLKIGGVSLVDIEAKKKFDVLTGHLEQHCPEWQDAENVSEPMKAGAAVFGHEKMLRYCNRSGLSRHDALYTFPRIVEMFNASGLTANQFYNNILQQALMDSSTHTEGTAHHRLNAIAQSLNLDFDEVRELASTDLSPDLAEEFLQNYPTAGDIFKSWKKLQRYSDLAKMIKQSEILNEMRELKEQGKDKLYKFIKQLAFHPEGNVDLEEVVRFWREPEAFLSTHDAHAPRAIHENKKPSNYLHIPHLDLSATELRDALVEGSLDKLQVFTPMEIRYKVPKDLDTAERSKKSVIDVYQSLKTSNMGKAKKMFGAVNHILKKYNITAQQYLSGAVVEVPPEANTELEGIIQNFDPSPPIETLTFIAKIHPKSSPVGILAGNDTACCMPFGSGKNNVYMFNPSTAMFTLQIERADGQQRTIAQSLLTKDLDVGKNVSDILRQIEMNVKMSDVLSEDVLTEGKAYACADNVEVAPNYKTDEYQRLIEVLYKDFFRCYMDRFAAKQGLCPDWMPIGKGHSDALTNLPVKPNTFVPEAPVSYSDKTHSEVFELTLEQEPGIQQREMKSEDDSKMKEPDLPTVRGIKYLHSSDTLPVAFLEGKIYADNQSLIVNLHNIENAIIAKDINNVHKGRPNMSLKYVDDSNKMRGYILAYEGKHENFGEVIYIADLAAERESTRAGGSLIKGFVDLYKRNYLDQKKYMPIYCEARETTSYKILTRQLEKLSEEQGVEFEMQELPTYPSGKDTMHPVLIKPKSRKGS